MAEVAPVIHVKAWMCGPSLGMKTGKSSTVRSTGLGGRAVVRKRTYFLDHPDEGWPDLAWLKPYFLTPEGRREAFDEQESWGLKIDGLDGTEHLLPHNGRIDLDLNIQGDPRNGIMLCWRVSGGGHSKDKYSLGQILRKDRWLRTVSGDRLPIGLFVPFEAAWLAVQEFTVRDGALAMYRLDRWQQSSGRRLRRP